MLPIQRIKIKENLGDIFSPCDIFVIVIPSLLSPLAWTWVSVTQCWRKLALDGRQIASTDTRNIYTILSVHPTLNSFPSSKLACEPRDGGMLCRLVRIRADIKLLSSGQFIKNPSSLCSQWQEKTLWSWNVSDFIGHFSELLDTIYPVFSMFVKLRNVEIKVRTLVMKHSGKQTKNVDNN